MFTIIALIIIILTLVFIRDTKIKVYNSWGRFEYEESLKLPIWAYILIILVEFIPILNIIIFLLSLFIYVLPPIYIDSIDKRTGFYLKGNNFIIRFLLNIKNFLNKKI